MDTERHGRHRVQIEGIVSAPGRDAGQLTLLQIGAPDWRLDRRTCEIGRLGVAAARAALQRASAADEQQRRSARAA